MESPRHRKFEWEVTAPQPDDSPRPTSTTETNFTGDSTDTLHYNDDRRRTPEPGHFDQRLVPQIAELALTPQVSRASRPDATRVATNVSTWTTDPAYEVDWEDEDPENPRNWPLWYKAIVIFSISFGTLVV